jgi:hypothetical protein
MIEDFYLAAKHKVPFVENRFIFGNHIGEEIGAQEGFDSDASQYYYVARSRLSRESPCSEICTASPIHCESMNS